MVRTRLARGLGSASIVGMMVVACASTDVEDVNPVADAGAPIVDASKDVTVAHADVYVPPPVVDTGAPVVIDSGTPPDPVGQCPSTCTYDSECQSACPVSSTGGTSCCDVGTNTCYLSASGTCDMSGGGDDGGLDGGTD